MAAGDAAMAVALADSVLFSIDPDAARSRVLLFLGISVVPFLVVAPLIGPAVDRMAGGRRAMIRLVAASRVVVSIAIAFHVDGLLLFPLAFLSMILQKTYAISKSALVPTVVRNEAELVEANSKLGLISGLVGAVAVVPAAGFQRLIGPTSTLVYAAAIFAFAFVAATRLPRERIDVVPATRGRVAPGQRRSTATLHSDGVVRAAAAMTLVRASVGFMFFHLFFWYRRQDTGLLWFGLALGSASLLTMTGNALAPRIRGRVREETMLVAVLGLIAATGLVTAVLGGPLAGVVLACAVNFSAALGRLAFESIVQRDAPDTNRAQAFARFETRFQLAWVSAGVVPVLLSMPGRLGFAFVGVIAVVATVVYRVGVPSRHSRPGPQRRPNGAVDSTARVSPPPPPPPPPPRGRRVRPPR
jgi:hypothetical protein